MAGFIRRFDSFPGFDVIQQIEGSVIIDLPPPGSVEGVGTGVVCCVGEFADMTYGTAVDGSGVVTTSPQPIEVTSSQDLLDKVGGFDETLGQFGGAFGNGFCTLRGKKFARLVVLPINLAAANGVRAFRDLPTNKSASDTTPAVLLVGATLFAGKEFKTGASRARVCARKAFTALGAYKTAIDGAVTAAGSPAATQPFGSASGGFLTANNGGPVKKGDIVVVGVIGGAAALGANALTLRVQTDAVSDTQLVLEKMDGSTFDWTTGTGLPYRVHPSTDADTGGANAAADTGGYGIPARPLDATIAAATTVAPTVAAAAATATTWDPLSGLKIRTKPGGALTYDANVHAPNAANHASIDALYALAIDALLTDNLPAREVNLLMIARMSSTIRNKVKSHVLSASGVGIGRTADISPELTNLTTAIAIGDSDPGVGANRDERVNYSWPGALTFIPEAVGYSLKGADGVFYTDGKIDTFGAGWLTAIKSNLAPERNPGQSSAPVPSVMSPVLGFQRGAPNLNMTDYILLKGKGVCALRIHKKFGPMFQSGVTTSLVSGRKNQNRRRMADFLEDSLAQQYDAYTKEPLTPALQDTITTETDSFLGELKSDNNRPLQRISDYLVDDKSGNTKQLNAKGIFVIIVKVRTLATMDNIVLQAEIGEGVLNITTT